jgi:hypothetical protein
MNRVEVYQMMGWNFQALAANERGHYPIAPLGIELGIWKGEYKNATLPWLRCWDNNGRLLPVDSERADEANRRAERLAARLRELGQDSEQI